MKKLILSRKWAIAFLGVVLAFNVTWNANAQQLSFHVSKQGVEDKSDFSKNKNTEPKEELKIERLEIEIKDIPTVTFINKTGEVVAVLFGDKNVLKEIYRYNLHKSYFMSSYGKHEIYLIN